MQLVSKEEYFQNQEKVLKQIKKGSLFVYPTDTTYRLGCDATNSAAVSKLRAIKKDPRPFSIIAPSKQWIRENCHVTDDDHLDVLPGRYSLLFDLKNKGAVARNTVKGKSVVGVRIPKHWSHDIAMLLGKPIVSCAANVVGEPYITHPGELPTSMRSKIDVCLYDKKRPGKKITFKDHTRKSQS